MQDYNQMIAQEIDETNQRYIQTHTQPTMIGGRKLRQFVLPGLGNNFAYPSTLAVSGDDSESDEYLDDSESDVDDKSEIDKKDKKREDDEDEEEKEVGYEEIRPFASVDDLISDSVSKENSDSIVLQPRAASVSKTQHGERLHDLTF